MFETFLARRVHYYELHEDECLKIWQVKLMLEPNCEAEEQCRYVLDVVQRDVLVRPLVA